mgnify:FL=1
MEFEDTDFNRDSSYYVRAIQEETPAINGKNITIENGEVKICKGSFKTSLEDDCLSLINERAWSSPIFLTHPMSIY